MSQLKHFIKKGKENLICDLKQSPRMRYQNFDTYVLSLRFLRSKYDHCVYLKSDNGHILIIVLYVDDMLFIGNGKGTISNLKSQLSTQFEMEDLGVVRYILGIEIIQDRTRKNICMS